MSPDSEDPWLFRYEYNRETTDHYAPGHVHIRGSFADFEGLGPKSTLERIHFPTGRVPLESIIRLLADNFQVDTNEPEQVWRPLLHQTEQAFIQIARQPAPQGKMKRVVSYSLAF